MDPSDWLPVVYLATAILHAAVCHELGLDADIMAILLKTALRRIFNVLACDIVHISVRRVDGRIIAMARDNIASVTITLAKRRSPRISMEYRRQYASSLTLHTQMNQTNERLLNIHEFHTHICRFEDFISARTAHRQ
jgi:hypothetical protein